MCHHHGEFDWEAMREEIAEADDTPTEPEVETEREADHEEAEDADEQPPTVPTADD